MSFSSTCPTEYMTDEWSRSNLFPISLGDVEHLAAQVHGDLPRVGDVARPLLSHQISMADFVVALHLVLDRAYVETFHGARRKMVFQQGSNIGKGDIRIVEVRNLRDNLRHGAFELEISAMYICISSGTYRS